MSDAAIVAVTSALRRLLADETQAGDDYIPGAQVTTLPLDKAQETDGKRINLFLYQVVNNGNWRNMDRATWQRAGGQGTPPLAIDLFYLLTAYDQSGDEANLTSQHLLGRAMRILSEKPILDPSPHEQIESLRLTPQPLSLDEMSKLWTIFQTQYRTSVAYRVSVVLIDSQRTAPTPLPVLQRGPGDQGVISQPDLIPPVPTLTKIELPDKQPSLLLNDQLIIHGHKLSAETSVKLIFRHSSLPKALNIAVQASSTANKLILQPRQEPQAAQTFPAGFYQVMAALEKQVANGTVQTQTTNALTFPLAPRIVLPAGATTLNAGLNHREEITRLTLTCEPAVWPDQQVALLLGSREFKETREDDATEQNQPRTQLIFKISTPERKLPAGSYRVRLRVDGVDSHLVTDFTAMPLTFDDTLTVTINE